MKKKLIIGVISALALILIILVTYYHVNLGPVKGNYNTTFTINNGESATKIIKRLKDEKLIRSELITKLFCYLNNSTSFQAGDYEINQNMNVNTIIYKFNNGDVVKNVFTLKLVEGKRLVDYIDKISLTLAVSNNMDDELKGVIQTSDIAETKILASIEELDKVIKKYILSIDDSTSITNKEEIIKKDYEEYKEELTELLKNKEYLSSLVDNYWFIDESILNDKIYYPLEGYLYPDTYQFKKGAGVKDVVDKLISTLNTKITPYKEDIEKSKYSFHELLTLSSIIEAEAATDDDRKLVSGVFYNRLKDGWSLGSDVTSYYGVHKTFTDTILYTDLIDCNPYNTRGNCVKGLPIGPINSPSFSSIYASIHPTDNDYYFFVADKTKKVYFSKTSEEQGRVIQDLKNKGLWL
ncbi:MAG: endolytic transglycosylase MltG [Firmicutes bacterium]|nr:endolytic transglycosylase MltG [Bacillota bacterium]